MSEKHNEPRVISENWFRLISFVDARVPNGEIKVKIINSQPTKLLDIKEDIRFDKELPNLDRK